MCSRWVTTVSAPVKQAADDVSGVRSSGRPTAAALLASQTSSQLCEYASASVKLCS